MIRNSIHTLLAVSFVFLSAGDAFAWGRGGGFAVGGFRGGGFAGGGYRSFDAGGYRNFDAGGYRSFGAGGYRSFDAAGYRGVDAGGFRGVDAAGYRGVEAGGFRAGAVGVGGGRAAMATDFGFGHVAGVEGARGFVAAGNITRAFSPAVLT